MPCLIQLNSANCYCLIQLNRTMYCILLLLQALYYALPMDYLTIAKLHIDEWKFERSLQFLYLPYFGGVFFSRTHAKACVFVYQKKSRKEAGRVQDVAKLQSQKKTEKRKRNYAKANILVVPCWNFALCAGDVNFGDAGTSRCWQTGWCCYL